MSALSLELDHSTLHPPSQVIVLARTMHISVTDAKAQLTERVRRAEAGDEVILTRHGQPAVRLTPVTRRLSRAERATLRDELSAAGARKASLGPCAARSQDFLYGNDGLPE